MSEAIAYYSFSSAWAILKRTPEKQARKIFSLAADRSWKRNTPGVQQYRKNLERVLPDGTSKQALEKITRDGVQSYARYWCEMFQMPTWSDERVLSIVVKDLDIVTRELQSPPAPVCVGPHSGNYDQAAAYVSLHYGAMCTVVERLKPYKLYDRFTKEREKYNMEVIPSGAPDALDTLITRAKAGTLVAFTGERDLSKRGIEVEFFGEETRIPAGPALIAYEAKSKIIPASFYYNEDSKAACDVFDPIDIDFSLDKTTAVQKATQEWANQISVGIAENPQDWHMFQPLWLKDLKPRPPR